MKKDMLTRIAVGAALIIMFVSLLILGGYAQMCVFSVAAILLVYEMKTALRARELFPFAIPTYIFAASIYPVYYFFGLHTTVLVGFLCMFATISVRLFPGRRSNNDLFSSLVLYFYPTIFYLFFVLCCTIGTFEQSRVAMLTVFAVSSCTDMFAYFVGVLFGKHKLCPDISPKKTIEGAFGGMLGSIAGTMIVYFVQPIYGCKISFLPLLIFGLILGVLSQIGDMLASCIKRWATVKDFGTLLPGHGGMLDRLDSILLCSPFVYFFFYYVFEGHPFA